MTAFSIITGVATLIGFFLQIKGLFPDYRRYYLAATFILFGITIGIGIASLTQISITVPDSLSPMNIMGLILYGGSGLLIFLCFAAAAMIENDKRRTEVSKIGSGVSTFLVFLIMFFTSTFFPTAPTDRHGVITLTYDEQIECAMSAIKKQSFERGLIMLMNAQASLPTVDQRREGLTKLIEQVRGQQASLPSQLLPTVGSSTAK